jgi:hypothetical protein
LPCNLYTAYQYSDVKKLAKLIHIKLEFIPTSMTDRCQLLERRVYGAMKERARTRIEVRVVFAPDDAMTTHESVVIFLEVWKQTIQGEALGAWDHFRGVAKMCS